MTQRAVRALGLGTALSLVESPQRSGLEVTHRALVRGSQDIHATFKGRETSSEKRKAHHSCVPLRPVAIVWPPPYPDVCR